MKTQSLRFSYEFFPPRTPTMTRRLWRAVGQLERLNPQFFSMTYGALGTTQDVSIETAIAMQVDSRVPVESSIIIIIQRITGSIKDAHESIVVTRPKRAINGSSFGNHGITGNQ